MKPIQYIVHRDTVWYNLNDYINFLLAARIVQPILPQLRKNHKPNKTPFQVVFDKLEKFESAYHIRYNNELYVDWVVFEYFFRPLKPFLVSQSDWREEESLFRQTQFFINESKITSNRKTAPGTASYFHQVSPKWQLSIPH
ncbi:hypothetical protein [Dyadobacter sp. CY326]|uniref:hypothetical protein n=1 Tax=Dyadobacter sp. CY326 TaxID=2907300 RepID=UPI001F35E4A1|nr:hypothetical protein [Dyadobacter sp. CY326]MCE7063908.1 hypothetical protein [Dyadobacter sp. CY326]